MDEKEILQGCGLTPTESLVYMELLKLGPSTAYKVAKEASVHKSNTYAALKTLADKGLVSLYTSENNTIYQTNDPVNLLNILKRKEEGVATILPRLKLLEGLSGGSKSEASILKGIPTFMNLCYSLLEYKQPIYVYGIPKVAPETLKLYIMDFHKERSKRKIQMDHIYNYDAADRIKLLRKLPYTGAKSLPDSVESGASTMICGPEVCITIWKDNNVRVVRVKDEEIAKSYTNYFKFLWELAK